MKNFARYLGLFGLVLLCFGLLSGGYFFDGPLFTAALVQIGLGLLAIGTYLAYFARDALKIVIRNQQAIFGLFGGAILLTILIAANVIAYYEGGKLQWDLTQNKINSLSPESTSFIDGLEQELQVIAFLQDGAQQKPILTRVMQMYTDYSDRISYEIVDPDTQPGQLERYSAQPNEIVVRNKVTNKQLKLTGLTEQDLTTAFQRIVATDSKTIYFLQGHGEGDLMDQKSTKGLFIAKYYLENEGYTVKDLNLAKTPSIPGDADIIAAWGATRPYTQAEVNLLKNYLAKGGSLVIGADPLLNATKDSLLLSGLSPLLAEYGLRLEPSVLLEYQIQLMRGKVINMKLAVVDYGQHEITKGFGGQSVSEVILAQPVTQMKNYKGEATRTDIFSTSENSWAETDIRSIFQSQKPTPGKDKKGPLPIGQIAEWKIDEKDPKKKAYLVVYGDSDFGSNRLIQSGYNRDVFLNTFNYIGSEKRQTRIRPKTWKASTLDLPLGHRKFIYYASLFIVPQLIILLGLAIWMLRRSRG